MAATTLSISAPEKYKKFIEENDFSQSQIFQSAVEEKADAMGVDLESYSG